MKCGGAKRGDTCLGMPDARRDALFSKRIVQVFWYIKYSLHTVKPMAGHKIIQQSVIVSALVDVPGIGVLATLLSPKSVPGPRLIGRTIGVDFCFAFRV